MSPQTERVRQFISDLDHPLKEVVQMVRSFILNTDKRITEHIKWNTPGFCYHGEERITVNLRARDHIKIIFHRGSRQKRNRTFTFEDETGLLKWLSEDRAVVQLTDMNDAKTKKTRLISVIKKWLNATGNS